MGNDTSLSFYSNIFGFVVGSISLLGFVVGLCRPHLPSNKFVTLEAVLNETENTFKRAIEDGLLVHEFVQMAENRLALLREETCGLRDRAYHISFCQDYAGFLNGTSTAIGRTCQSLKKLKDEVITSSEENRRIHAQTNPVEVPHPIPPVRSEHGRPPIPQRPTEITRCHSCPPASHPWSLSDVQTVRIESCPSGNSARVGSDVRTVDAQT